MQVTDNLMMITVIDNTIIYCIDEVCLELKFRFVRLLGKDLSILSMSEYELLSRYNIDMRVLTRGVSGAEFPLGVQSYQEKTSFKNVSHFTYFLYSFYLWVTISRFRPSLEKFLIIQGRL